MKYHRLSQPGSLETVGENILLKPDPSYLPVSAWGTVRTPRSCFPTRTIILNWAEGETELLLAPQTTKLQKSMLKATEQGGRGRGQFHSASCFPDKIC